MISVVQLGTVDYATALLLQQKLVELRKAERISDTLLLLEHTPVITLGRNAKVANIIASHEKLSQLAVEIFESNRGGDVTFHGPGQIVGYPIFDLRTYPSPGGKRPAMGVVEYVRLLEEVLIRTCAGFGIPTKRVCGLTGVWTDLETNHSDASSCSNSLADSEAKIAAIGVHISRGVTSHGFALNVNTDLDFFNLIIPCGIAHKPVTSMAKELQRILPLEEVANAIVRNVGTIFNSQVLWVETLEALEVHPVGVPLQTPKELRKMHHEEDTVRSC